jgi:hypothetical protein
LAIFATRSSAPAFVRDLAAAPCSGAVYMLDLALPVIFFHSRIGFVPAADHRMTPGCSWFLPSGSQDAGTFSRYLSS